MKLWALCLAATLVAGCASVPPPPERLFKDRAFAAPSQPIRGDSVFALTPAMKAYLANEIAANVRNRGPQAGLFDALYARDQLRIEYESTMTRNAAQTFDARAGNCLSQVIMTAAFAKEMGLVVRYQHLYVEETWSRAGDLYLSIGHVNITLANVRGSGFANYQESDQLTIDFLPPSDLRGHRTRAIEEKTIVAMYMNNRAVESLAAGSIDDAYWFAREAIRQDEHFTSGYNTLGAVYQRYGDLAQAEMAFRYALEREPRNARALSNVVAVLNAQGRRADAEEFAKRLAQIEPDPPFSYFNRGMVAIRTGDYRFAQQMFAKEVARSPYYHEFHFWLAIASLALDDYERARAEMALAIETSPTRSDRDLYAAKLDKLKATRTR